MKLIYEHERGFVFLSKRGAKFTPKELIRFYYMRTTLNMVIRWRRLRNKLSDFFRWLKEQFVWLTDKEVLQMVNDGEDYERIEHLVSIKADGYTVKYDFNDPIYDRYSPFMLHSRSAYITPKTHKLIKHILYCTFPHDIEARTILTMQIVETCGRILY